MRDNFSQKTAKRLTPTIDDVKKKLPGNVGISSGDSEWEDIVFHEFLLPNKVTRGKGVTPATKAHKIGLFFNASLKGELSINRETWKNYSCLQGGMYITPGGDELAWAWSSSKKQKVICLGFHISPHFFNKVIEEVYDKEPLVTPILMDNACQDPLLNQLIISIYTEFQANKHQGSAYLETASQFIVSHLLHRQNKKKLPIKEYKGGLNKIFLKKVLAYIEGNLSQRISMDELAAYANLSVYHFVRMFKYSVGQTPHQYIIKLRMQRADQLLQNTDLSISQIALDVGYDEMSNFSYAYKKYKGCSPKFYRISVKT